MAALDLQMLIGLILYFALSPITGEGIRHIGTAMGNAGLRFWTVEHPFGMVIGLALAHIGRGLRSGAVGAHRGVRSYLAGIDRDLRPYLIGFALALILTAIPFALVAINPWSKPTTLIIIGIAAAIQVLVHLRYFLHLDLTSTPRENLVAIVFTAILIVLMVGGSFWIMFDLHNRMAM